MADLPRPKYHDYQPPKLYQAGCTLRRSYLTGKADSVEEGMMLRLLERFDQGTLRPKGDAGAKATTRALDPDEEASLLRPRAGGDKEATKLQPAPVAEVTQLQPPK